MLRITIRSQQESLSNPSLSKTLLDGVSFYGISMFDKGRYLFPLFVIQSEGLVTPYGQGAPAWGGAEMFTDGVVGVGYDCQWDLTGASTPTTYSLITGALPDGLALESVSGNTGRITGTPTVAGTFNFTLRATNDYGTDDKAFSITITAPAEGGGGAWAFIS